MTDKAVLIIADKLRQASHYAKNGQLTTAYELWKETGPMIEKELDKEENHGNDNPRDEAAAPRQHRVA